MALTYPIAVRPLADTFPELAQIPTLVNHRINEGDENAAHSAEMTVHELETLRPAVAGILDAAGTVGGDNILANLDEIRRTGNDNRATLQQIQESIQQQHATLQRNEAMIANIRLANQNNMVPHDRDNYTPLQKTTIGHGHGLAMQASRPDNVNLIPPIAAIQVAEVGTCPAFWNPVADGYTMRTISQLIIFYNNDFGIQPADNMDVRKSKFRRWLCS
ncbi:hypothetical protein DFJ58DRAFT_835439 [Suillus subalutaceus]|uniref:uncharacterized protein n=1 Tax=Suillus subalutaceus TaxID=48586 RepID=UPI001B8693E5|nr:uncharacterized protein DFJ58DRAFT_835439 [Suillus subalutaceus]KAG1877708.1 hypothetical protein DFJ58DRAFT_835439 [Suillus subalutaceus]